MLVVGLDAVKERAGLFLFSGVGANVVTFCVNSAVSRPSRRNSWVEECVLLTSESSG